MTIYDLKPAFQNLLRPLCRMLVRKGVSPNQVTLSALGLSLITGLLIISFSSHRRFFILIPMVLLVRMALNAIDGMIAREHNQATPLGAMLNELGDVISDTALYLPFSMIPGIYSWLVILVVLGAVVTEMAGVVAVQIGANRRYDGPMGKSDRAFVFSVMSLLCFFGVSARWGLNSILLVILILLVATVVNRIRGALKELNT